MNIDEEEKEVDVYLEVCEAEEGEDKPSSKLSLSISDNTS